MTEAHGDAQAVSIVRAFRDRDLPPAVLGQLGRRLVPLVAPDASTAELSGSHGVEQADLVEVRR